MRRWPVHEFAARQHAEAWTKALFAEPQEIISWWDAGYNYDQLSDVTKLHREGIITPALLEVEIDGRTLRQLLRRGDPAHYVARLLRDRGRI